MESPALVACQKELVGRCALRTRLSTPSLNARSSSSTANRTASLYASSMKLLEPLKVASLSSTLASGYETKENVLFLSFSRANIRPPKAATLRTESFVLMHSPLNLKQERVFLSLYVHLKHHLQDYLQ